MFIVVSMLRKSMPKFQLHCVSALFMPQNRFQRHNLDSSSCTDLTFHGSRLYSIVYLLIRKSLVSVTFRCCFRIAHFHRGPQIHDTILKLNKIYIQSNEKIHPYIDTSTVTIGV
jgi:hypothetical protein